MLSKVRAASTLLMAGALAFLGASSQAGEPGAIETIEHQRPEMVFIPAGVFSMGFGAELLAGAAGRSDEVQEELLDLAVARLEARCVKDYGEELQALVCADVGDMTGFAGPARRVYLRGFYLDRHEVTVAQYRTCVAAGGCVVAPLLTGDERYRKPEWPMVKVSWFEAQDYCRWAGKRLPTEAEWEKAARGTQAWTWPWGNFWRKDGGNIGKRDSKGVYRMWETISGGGFLTMRPDDRDGHRYLAPPGALRWGKSPYGVMDMAGNVAEWTADEHSRDGYEGLPSAAPLRQSSPTSLNRRVVRGGSWVSPAFSAMTFVRFSSKPTRREIDLGFRCARDS
jgi:formylglycine-generating enzyme required for sulfatase activity